ncbi:MAG TPA: hypothetical protein VFY28_02995 [Candidatus Paceibacterota bacterium]|nr:hypothetical protein [Candidatus Paceibacterota bacterium]
MPIIKPKSPIKLRVTVFQTPFGNAFALLPADGSKPSSFTATLVAPFAARHESIVITRNGSIVREGVIKPLPHGDEGNFYWGLTEHSRAIAADDFEPGDEITVTSLSTSEKLWPSPFFERTYWIAMLDITRAHLVDFYFTPELVGT